MSSRPLTIPKDWPATRASRPLSGPPPRYKSGSSVRGKTRVSQHARLRLKSLFHLGAMSAIRMKGELQVYYQRKVGQGKNRMLVLNAVRNNRTADAAYSSGLLGGA